MEQSKNNDNKVLAHHAQCDPTWILGHLGHIHGGLPLKYLYIVFRAHLDCMSGHNSLYFYEVVEHKNKDIRKGPTQVHRLKCLHIFLSSIRHISLREAHV